VAEPDYVIVQDATIMGELDVTEGLKDGGIVLLNTDKSLKDLGLHGKPFVAHTISADNLARRILGRPIINTALLGAFAAITAELTLQSALNAVRNKFPGEIGDKNAQVVQESYEQLMRKSS
jgi:pyruvate ferredoxin oxidoreductase gamma subunit